MNPRCPRPTLTATEPRTPSPPYPWLAISFELAANCGLSQIELARQAGIRPETLNRIEQGRNKPSIPTIAKIDRALTEFSKG